MLVARLGLVGENFRGYYAKVVHLQARVVFFGAVLVGDFLESGAILGDTDPVYLDLAHLFRRLHRCSLVANDRIL